MFECPSYTTPFSAKRFIWPGRGGYSGFDGESDCSLSLQLRDSAGLGVNHTSPVFPRCAPSFRALGHLYHSSIRLCGNYSTKGRPVKRAGAFHFEGETRCAGIGTLFTPQYTCLGIWVYLCEAQTLCALRGVVSLICAGRTQVCACANPCPRKQMHPVACQAGCDGLYLIGGGLDYREGSVCGVSVFVSRSGEIGRLNERMSQSTLLIRMGLGQRLE